MLRDFGIVTVVDLTRLAAGRACSCCRPRCSGPRSTVRSGCATSVRGVRGCERRAPRRAEHLVSDDDRFDDLHHRRAARRARPRPHPEPVQPPEVPRPGNKYAWVVGILMFMGLGFAAVRPARCRTPARPCGPRARAERLPAFAAPLATATSRATPTSARSGPARSRPATQPACELRSEEVVNVCELRERPLVLTFVVDARRRLRAAGGPRRAGAARAARRRLRDRRDFSDSRSETRRELVRQRGAGTSRSAVDHDGAVANLLRHRRLPDHGVRPRAGGCVTTKLGNLTEDAAAARRRRLRAADGARARRGLGRGASWPRSSPSSARPRAARGAAAAQPAARSSSGCASSPTATPAARSSTCARTRCPWAYRVFSRQVGIDPDTDRTPVEAIALERLRHGGLQEPRTWSTTRSRSPSPRPACR